MKIAVSNIAGYDGFVSIEMRPGASGRAATDVAAAVKLVELNYVSHG